MSAHTVVARWGRPEPNERTLLNASEEGRPVDHGLLQQGLPGMHGLRSSSKYQANRPVTAKVFLNDLQEQIRKRSGQLSTGSASPGEAIEARARLYEQDLSRQRCCCSQCCRRVTGCVAFTVLLFFIYLITMDEFRVRQYGEARLLPQMLFSILSLRQGGTFRSGAQLFLDDYFIPARIWSLFDPAAAAHFEFAARYYQQERPKVLASASKHKLHWYFANMKRRVHGLSASLYNMITYRLEAMVQRLEDEGRDDFKIEKDKCAMYSFFGRNSLPHPRLLGVWRSVDASVEALRSMANGSALARAHDEAEAHADVRARAAASVAAVAAAAFTKLSNLSRIRPSLPALHVSSPQPLEYKWPLFIKACHLTMGGAHSVKMLRSPDWVQALAHLGELREWLQRMWDYVPDDGRVWRDAGNKLTDEVLRTKGFMIQESAPLSQACAFSIRRENGFTVGMRRSAEQEHNPEANRSHVVELKVEVVWGRAYLAQVNGLVDLDFGPNLSSLQFFRGDDADQDGGGGDDDGDGGDGDGGGVGDDGDGVGSEGGGGGVGAGNGTGRTLATIDHSRSATIEAYPRMADGTPQLMHPSRTYDGWYKFIRDEGHLELCVWPLAEQTARLAAIDEIRIDIFVSQGQPRACLLNEDSISSGAQYMGHGMYLAKLWSEPYLLQSYTVSPSPQLPVRVYEATAADLNINADVLL